MEMSSASCSRPLLERLVAESGGSGQQPLAARQIRDVETEPGDEQRPLIEQPDHHDVAGTAGVVVVGGHKVLARVDRIADRNPAEGRIALHVYGNTVVAVEQDV